MKLVSVREFRDHATRLMRGRELVLVMRDGTPAGFFIPLDHASLDDDVRKTALDALAASIREEREAKGVTEQEVLDDFAAHRQNARRRR